MDLHLINYDLTNPGQNYNKLIEAIKSYDYWAKICESCWAVKTNQSDAQIRDYLKQFLDSNDRLFVCTFSWWASWNLPKEVTDWLKS